ncbi:MAG: BatA and WFA domain-containing protein [Planctomycetes bacterium]|nr:BatA and WFA domain-containing protein [Planctomycetota bacterium]
MTFTQPLGLLALLAVPAVVLLHLFRNKLPQRRIAASFLFPDQALLAGAGRTRTRLLRTPSFWCELLAAILLAAWLGGLSFGGRRALPLVLVLDGSASMAAKGTQALAQERVRARLAAHGGGAFVGILRTGSRPEILLDPRDPAPDVDAALQRWAPSLPRHDVHLALDVARELAGPDGEVVFVTDEPAPPGHADVEVLGCGVRAANAALLGAERLPGAPPRLRIRAQKYGELPAATVVVSADGKEVARAAVPWQDAVADFTVAWPGGHDVVAVQLDADALAIDDAVLVVPPPLRTVAIADELAPATRAALASERAFAAVPDWRPAASRAEAQLVLADAPGPVAGGQCELVVTRGTGELLVHKPPFTVDRASPLGEGLRFDGVQWVAGAQELPGRVLVAAGPHVLASEEGLDTGRRVWLRLVGEAGNLVRAPDWPVLCSNLVEGVRGLVPGPLATAVAIGQEIAWRQRPGDAPLLVEAPGGARQNLAFVGDTGGFVPTRPGLHHWVATDGRIRGTFAASFVDASESDLRAVVAADRPAQAIPATSGRASVRDTGFERRLLVVMVLLCLVADWWLLQRREA